MHKEENITYYKKMLNQRLLTKDKYEPLVGYWEKMKCCECPVCGKDTLEWRIVEGRE